MKGGFKRCGGGGVNPNKQKFSNEKNVLSVMGFDAAWGCGKLLGFLNKQLFLFGKIKNPPALPLTG